MESMRKLAIVGVLLLISFLAGSSQLLFPYLDPGPLSRKQSIVFNILIINLLISYARSCLTDPGRIPKDWKPQATETSRNENFIDNNIVDDNDLFVDNPKPKQRWCRKCEAPKPPRAHHCRLCQRCIPKMDHHCPWTSNCVSHRTLPHFLRFLFYSVASMTFLSYHLYAHSYPIWATRKFPSYLGPSVFQLTHLFVLLITNSLTWFALTILLFRTLWSLVTNTTTIEAWEIERHETLLRRAKYFGGWLDGPDGSKVRIVRQEFPYDIGVWRNVVQGMGTANPVGWFWVLGKDMGRGTGWEWEVNGFEESGRTWPPPDPDRMPRRRRGWVVDGEGPFVHDNGDVEGFRRRQEEDLRRRRRRPFVERLEARQAGREVGDFESSDGEDVEDEIRESPSQRRDYVATRGEEDWKNAEGESLADFGLDEDAEFYDEEDVPLSELMRRKRLQRSI